MVTMSEKKDTNVCMVSLGCPKNLVDSEAMLGILSGEGYSVTTNADEADVIIVNTCSFIGESKKESINAILSAAEKKEKNCKHLIVTGCLSERYGNEFSETLPEVDAALGVGEYNRIAEVTESLMEFGHAPEGLGSEVETYSIEDRLKHLAAKRLVSTGHGYAYLKIAEGCDNRCAFCVIPNLRGRYISRTISDLVAEATEITKHHEMELILVAQDTNHYGMDLGDGSDLYQLMDKLEEIENVKWIRILYCYPEMIDETFIRYFSKNKKLLKYIDMPIQHINNNILQRMGRRYDRTMIERLLPALRREIPGLVLRTTVMTGFPGETEEDFAELEDFVKLARFDRLGVFAFSREEGTPAATMRKQIGRRLARHRQLQIIRTQDVIDREADQHRIGCEYEAIVDGPGWEQTGRDRKKEMERGGFYSTGRTYGEAPDIDGIIRIHSEQELKSGEFVRVRITDAKKYGWDAEVLA